ncbi:hypothetical protein [Phaeobacter sp. CECT 5382]|uniref:hypothetical protein n=1 Tax=Phaeobacter sp. CECT 5382 TaxID=1712645 RepID=UPI0018D23529|nr:hypothetical protein [Phaeobacter sp. CECT 5382]
MPSFSEGIVLPAPSRADRKIQNVSKWHCTVHTVRGRGAGTRMQGESKLEADHQALQYAQPDVADVVEQALFKFGWRDEKRHVFDMLVTKTNGERVACTVKPTSRLHSKDFLSKMEVVAWWVQKKEFASSVRLLTEADIDQVALHNANLNAAVHDSDPEAENAVRAIACHLGGAITIKTLTDEVGLKERGYRAILRLISKRELQSLRHERTTPQTLIQWKGFQS